MLCESVSRVPLPSGSSSHRRSPPPQLYSSSLGASARFTVVSETSGVPTVESFTGPTVARLPSASNRAHSRRCSRSVEACLPQHPEVLRYGGLRHPELAFELPDRPLRRGEKVQQGAAARLGENGEGGFHGSYIPSKAYACQGTFMLQVARLAWFGRRLTHAQGWLPRFFCRWQWFASNLSRPAFLPAPPIEVPMRPRSPVLRLLSASLLAALALSASTGASEAAVAHRSSSSVTVATGNAMINKPAGTVNGDVMVAAVAVRPNTVSITPPTGWTLIQRVDNPNASSSSIALYYRVASSEGATYTWTLGGNTGAAVATSTFSGVDTSSPINAGAGQNTPSGVSHAAPSITPTVNNAMVLSLHSYSSSNPWTPPAGMTEDVDVSSGIPPSTNG